MLLQRKNQILMLIFVIWDHYVKKIIFHIYIYIYSIDINDNSSVKFIRECNPDIIYCFGWSQLIKSEILNIPKLGVIGNHPAELPKNRGRHPIIWALALGLKQTASTFFIMNEGLIQEK